MLNRKWDERAYALWLAQRDEVAARLASLGYIDE